MKKLKRIRIFPFAKFQALLFLLIGILCGIIYSFGGLVIDILVTYGVLSAEDVSSPGLSFGTVLAFGALVGMPLLFAAAGFLTGVIEAILFNLLARYFGGIKTDFE